MPTCCINPVFLLDKVAYFLKLIVQTPLQTPIQTPLPGTMDQGMYNIPTGPSDYSPSPITEIRNSVDLKGGRPSPYMVCQLMDGWFKLAYVFTTCFFIKTVSYIDSCCRYDALCEWELIGSLNYLSLFCQIVSVNTVLVLSTSFYVFRAATTFSLVESKTPGR